MSVRVEAKLDRAERAACILEAMARGDLTGGPDVVDFALGRVLYAATTMAFETAK